MKVIHSWPHLVLTIIILSGLFLRFYNLGESSLWIDEGYTINASQAILEHGTPQLDSGEFYRGGLLTSYLTAGTISIFGFDPFSPWSARLPALAFSLALVIMMSALTQRLFRDHSLTIMTAFLTSFSTWEIAWSRQARGYTILSFFIILTLWYLWRFQETRQKKYLIGVILASLAGYFSHSLGLVFLPVLILLGLIWLILKHPNWSIAKVFIGMLITFALTIASIALWTRWQDLNLYNWGEAYWHFLITELPLFFWGAIVGIILGLNSKKYFWAILILSVALIIPLIIITEYGPLLHYRYLFPFFPLMIILTLYALKQITNLINRVIKLKPIFTNLLFISLTIILSYPYLNFIPRDHYRLEFGSPQPNFAEAYAIIKNGLALDLGEDKEKIVISPYAHLSKIYLDQTGLWLPISLSGKSQELNNLEVEPYVNAPIIADEAELEQILAEQSGYIIIDEMATPRLNQILPTITQHPKVKLIYKSGSQPLEKIWLYQF